MEYKEVRDLRAMVEVGNQFTVTVGMNQKSPIDARGYIVTFTSIAPGRLRYLITTQRNNGEARIFPSLDKAVKTIYETSYKGDVVVYC